MSNLYRPFKINYLCLYVEQASINKAYHTIQHNKHTHTSPNLLQTLVFPLNIFHSDVYVTFQSYIEQMKLLI